MVRQLYPEGDAQTFVGENFLIYLYFQKYKIILKPGHIMRVFDTDGNDYLDFKEFLMAMDISNCQTSELYFSQLQNFTLNFPPSRV